MNTTTSPHNFRGFRRTMHAVGPELRDQMRAALEDAGVTRQQWRILAALENGPATADAIDEAAKRRHRRRRKDSAAAGAGTDGVDSPEQTDDRNHLGHPFGGGGVGRFGRRGFGPGFGPFGRGFGPGFGHGHGFGPGFGPHAGPHGRRRPTSEVLDGLAERGFVSRDGVDAGTAAWTLTESGTAELARITAKVTAVTASLRDGISDDDWASAMAVLQRVAANTRR